MKKPNGYWSKERCQKESLKYKTRSEFKFGSPSSYQSAWKNKWIDEICNHMKLVGHKYKRCLYVFEFNDNHVYIGLTFNIKERYNNHLRVKSSTVYKYINNVNNNYIFKQICDYDHVDKIKYMEEIKIQEYKNNGWLILNKVKGGNIGSNFKKWNYNSCKEISLKYNNLKKFRKEQLGAYLNIIRNKWNKLLIHMEYNKTWNKDDEKFLIDNYYKGSKFCSEKLNRTIDSIHNRAIKLGVKINKKLKNN